MIVIVDYDMGNVGSIHNMLEHIGASSIISSNPSDLEAAAKIILPGVGTFDKAMENLTKRDLIPILNKRVKEDGIPILGICLGMQLFTQKSEEGQTLGLGWLDAQTVRFKFDNPNLKIPHMGWNFVTYKDTFPEEMPRKYYFVHSYHVICNDAKDIWGACEYGRQITAAVKKGNMWGVQFHPEKSHKYGVEFFHRFISGDS